MYKLDVESEAYTSIVQRFWYSSCFRNADLLQLFFCRNEMRVESRDSNLRNLIVIFYLYTYAILSIRSISIILGSLS